jgi:hypothetical protein
VGSKKISGASVFRASSASVFRESLGRGLQAFRFRSDPIPPPREPPIVGAGTLAEGRRAS